MNLNSLTTKITLIFLFALLMVSSLFFYSIQYEKRLVHEKVTVRYQEISTHLRENRMRHDEAGEYIEGLNFEPIEKNQEILDRNNVVIAKRGYETLLYQKSYYLLIKAPDFHLLFRDLTHYQVDRKVYLIFALLIVLLLSIYFWLIWSLKPLHDLKQTILKFAQGDLTVSCASTKRDEIADVANAFDSAVKKIDLLLQSRQLFLRAVMHELKTPIAKGRIVSELTQEEKQRERLVTIFEKLDFLVNDFAQVEQIVSHNYRLSLQNHKVNDIVDQAIAMLMLDRPNEKITVTLLSNSRLNADFDLISMAIKNLMDNAIKYSDDKKVEIVETSSSISVRSKGAKLSQPIESYFKPFHNEADKTKQGMGLGLYIVKSILDMHGMGFEYAWREGVNVFRIKKSAS